MRRCARLSRLLVAALLLGGGWLAASATAAEVDYLREVKPLLADKCGACHGAVRQKSGLRLDSGQLVHRGGDSGPAIVLGQSAQSLLIKKLSASEGETLMPPEGEGKPLTSAEIDVLRRWIDAGAKFPADETIPADPRDHWSFQPPQKAPLPPVKQPAWVRNPLDTFVAARWEQQGLTLPQSADRATLLRRVYLDLIGLPPTRAELHAFLADQSSTAYEQVVDRLLDRPEYGERWGRHWMDVWRYCDWHGSGNEMRYSQRHIWRWRDWIVRSLNADKGYDRMIVEMLAGDEIAPDDPDVVAATGFIGRNWYKFDRNVWMRELVEHTAVGFLGTTLKCARCHDHKFDPISQEEYYRFRAFFEPHQVRTDRLFAATEYEAFKDVTPVLKDGLSRAYDKTLDAPTYLFTRGDDRFPQKDRPLEPGVPQVLRGPALDVRPIDLPLASYAPMLQPQMLADLRAIAEQQIATAHEAWLAAPQDGVLSHRLTYARADRAALDARIAADVAKHVERAEQKRIDELATAAARLERAAALIQAELTLAESELALKSLPTMPPADDKAKAAVTAAEKKVADARQAVETARTATTKTDGVYTPLGEVYPTKSTGRRLALARWIADRTNPRTARVAVNQIWMRHFGEPLVATVADFGLRAKSPTDPELLDWLAVEFMEHGWSMKHVHRLIVTSRAWQIADCGLRIEDSGNAQSRPSLAQHQTLNTKHSAPIPHSAFRTPHFPPIRLEAEAIRDSLLFIAGMLDTTMGGREIPYTQDQSVPRRSLYFQTAPNRQSQLLQLFDVGSTEECYERKPSVVPQQSLALLNSPLAVQASQKVAARQGKLSDAEFVVAVFEEVLSRSPTEAESTRCGEFLRTQTRWLADTKTGPVLPASVGAITVAAPALRARENLVLVLFNHNDFVTVR